MDYRSLVNRLEAIQSRIDEADNSPEAYKRAQAAMGRLEQAAKYSGTDEIVRSRMGLPAPLPPIEQWDGTQPAPVGKPDWVARLLGTGGGATGDVQKDQDQAAATNTAIDGAATRSDEFIAQKLQQLTDLVAQLKGGSAPAAAPVAESVKLSAQSLVESFGYSLYEGGITLPAADGTTPPGAHTIEKQVALNQSMGKKALIQQIQALMAELADIEDPAVHAALADAQAAIEGGGKEQDRARMKELVAITQKPPVAQGSEFEESVKVPAKALSESERMAALRAKLDELNVARLPGMANKATEVLPKVVGKDVAVPPGPIWNINKPTVKDMGVADVVPKPALSGPTAVPKIGDPGFDFKKASKIAAGAAAAGGATYMAATGGGKAGGTPAPLPPTEPAGSVTQSGQAASAYTIQRGDTLSALAKKNGVSVADIMKANPSIKDPNKIAAGASLTIPSATGNPVYQGGAGAAPVKGAAAATPAAGGSKTDLTKFYADEMKEMETLIAKYASDPEMADDVKAAQAQLASLKATGSTPSPK